MVLFPAKKRSARRGVAAFTIMEVMISTLVMAFTIMTSLTVIQYGLQEGRALA